LSSGSKDFWQVGVGYRMNVGRRQLLLGLGFVGCVPRAGARSVLGRYFPQKVTVYLAVSSRVAQTDTGNIVAMIDVLEQELREQQRLVEIVAARLDEQPPKPRLELQVRDSDSGDAELRGAGQFTELLMPVTGVALVGVGGGSMTVDAYVVTGNEQLYVGRFESGSFGAVSEASVAAGERVGLNLARRLAS
jgi:hypothetical protein